MLSWRISFSKARRRAKHREYVEQKRAGYLLFRRLAPTAASFPYLTNGQFLMILAIGIHESELLKQEATISLHHGCMAKIHGLLLADTESTRLVFRDSPREDSPAWLASQADRKAALKKQRDAEAAAKKLADGGTPTAPTDATPGRWPDDAKLKPSGFRRVTKSEMALRPKGCPKCDLDHAVRDCSATPTCANHPHCNFIKPHCTARCYLTKI